MTKKKILVVTPRLPVPPPGACEKDRYYNMIQLRDLGYEVAVLSKVYPWYDALAAREFERQQGITVTTVPYEFKGKRSLLFWLKHLLPWNWDGAAYEYTHSSVRQAFAKLLNEFKPDLVWFDYTYLWPLYSEVKKRGIPIITRSINFEARHFLEEDGYTLLNFIRFIPKFFSELITIKMSDWLYAITPDEQKTYEKYGGKKNGVSKISTLILRGLPKVLGRQVPVHDRRELKVFFMGSTYHVHHNKAALAYIIEKIAPIVHENAPGKFVFHILGKQIPEDLMPYIKDNVKYVGYQNPVEYLPDMDIAVTPSLFGAGMQQKIFEPLAFGFPSVTHARAIAGYDFQDGEHYLAATTPEDFAEKIISLADPALRKRLSDAAYARARELFAQEKIDQEVTIVLAKLLK